MNASERGDVTLNSYAGGDGANPLAGINSTIGESDVDGGYQLLNPSSGIKPKQPRLPGSDSSAFEDQLLQHPGSSASTAAKQIQAKNRAILKSLQSRNENLGTAQNAKQILTMGLPNHQVVTDTPGYKTASKKLPGTEIR